jgi:soluble lytic murein transglycosylase
MQAHALVLVVVLLLVTPATPLTGARSADALWNEGYQLVRRGDYAAAQQLYASMAEQLGASVAPRALLLQARAALADEDTETAEALLQQLLSDYPSSDQTASAYFALEQVRRTAGDCAGALRALAAFEALAGRTAIGPYAALQRAQCAAKLGDWPGELAAARAALSIDGGGPRLTRIEALERAAEAVLNMGRKQEALDFYNRALELAATRAYRAEMLFTTAALARALGQDELALERFRAVVLEYADQARAPGALDALIEMEHGGTLSPLQAGAVRLNARDYAGAIALLEQVDPASPDAGQAGLSRAEALSRLGRDDQARRALEAVAQTDTSQAGSALLRLGQLQERDGALTAAEQAYLRMAEVAPDRAAEAVFHVGFTRFIRGDQAAALAAWQTGLASGPPSPTLQAQLYYWSARAMVPDSAQRQEALQRAAVIAPESYYGLRAQDQLDVALNAASTGPLTNAAWLVLSPPEVQERSTWFAGFNTTVERAADDVGALSTLQRAETLLELGLRSEAGWEIDAAIQQYAQTNDVAHLSALADWLSNHDLPHLTLRVGRQIRDLVGYERLPRAVQKQVYPAGWGDLVAEQAALRGVDPLLILAMMRQESSFDPRAQSGAQAMGLTQVVPPTARSIAAHLGRQDFALRDLFKPAVSVEFGTWFMSQLLGEYKGRLFPALTAYNAGGANVARWLQRYGDDPDLLVEQVPFTETRAYLRIVYDNYWHYQLLYRDGVASSSGGPVDVANLVRLELRRSLVLGKPA